MSAYVVDRKHIIFLIKAAVSRQMASHGSLNFSYWVQKYGNRQAIQAGDYDAMVKKAQMLWDENILSINSRYPDTIGNLDRMPGPIDEDFIITKQDFLKIQFKPDAFTPANILKSCHCFEYQACEHDDWKTSEAHAFIQTLKSAAEDKVPGYDDAPWGCPETVSL